MILNFGKGNNGTPADSLEVQQIEAVRNALNPDTEYAVLPLRDIPVSYEAGDQPIHDGINPCGDPSCYCASYGYGVPSLQDRGW
jgi:hypothetical protein